ncbi:two-component system, NtrC family, sensor kinase [Thermodesulfovibrio aggregans]|uniref:histidine kinase n=1 Tax=Thermodesulfovibrio aggregans TaxID=86166 RepID=A0A0U9HLI6_9BACT|nr:PAS domain-containing sensor histidine kinase [Thermodesulfovibrio aggregans]GAQ93867.1 two-component system, NtrC family, sensor kinase [Thermodesulfovibrio aggregans]
MFNFIKQFITKLTEDRYFYLKFRLILFNTFFAIIPLMIVVTITYFWIYEIVHDEFKNNLRWQMEETRHSLEFFISERKSALKFIVSSYPQEYFSDEKKFFQLFSNFKREFEGIIDMGIINSNGIQTLYVGPYQLKGKDYSQTEWFKEMTLKSDYVTDVFLGYRKIPHFSIIIKKEMPSGGDFWLLRVSINMDILQKLISNLEIGSQDDVFLINKQLILQTNSKYFGNALEPLKLNIIIERESDRIKIYDVELNKKQAYIAYTSIRETPWILLTTICSKPYAKIPTFFTKEVTMISLLSIAIIFFVITTSINNLVNRVRKADHEREIAIANAEHADKLASIGRLAAGVAHEINNPLAIINEKAGLMKDLLEYGDPSQNKEKFLQLVSSIQDSVTRCKTITHRLLSFSKRIDKAREEFNINEAIQEVVGFIEKEIHNKGINIVYEFQEDLPKITTDKGQLQQVLLNIINNAVDAVDIGGTIEIMTRLSDKNHIKISIKDNGHGIPKDKLKHIFEPFYTTKKKGTGLGLYISYGIIKKLGGDITVQSEEGKGTIFTIEIPVYPEVEEIK